MKRSTFPLTFIFCLTAILASAQDPEVPLNAVMKTQEDFDKYQKNVLSCVDWLMATPIDQATEKRQDAGAFIMRWLSGTKSLSIEIKERIVNFMEVNPDLLLIFMCGWTQYALTTNDYDAVKCNTKGIEAVISYYQKNKDKLSKDKHVEKYIKMKEAGELEDFIRKNI